jgi:hypothetical protein
MAKAIQAFADRDGKHHASADAATVADILSILGGSGGGIADGMARTILAKRAELETVFAEHDAMMEGKEK